jgi:DNA processing protein
MQPLLLFCQGDVRMLGQPSAAVIGARDAGAEMVGFAHELSTLLAEEGLVVVSGLGKGIGQSAFEGALAAEGGRTAAVLPMGINAFAGVSGSAGDLTAGVDQGRVLLLSPFHPDAKFTEAQAIARNKLLVRVAEAVFVVAAREAGVARETADEALRIGETVYVWDIDPTVDPTAIGNQTLIESGALPITGVPDVLEAVEAIVATTLDLAEMAETPTAPPPPVTEANEPEVPYDPKTVLDLLSKTGQVPESLARRLQEGQEDEP